VAVEDRRERAQVAVARNVDIVQLSALWAYSLKNELNNDFNESVAA
jgi:hypothetical protein